MKITRTPICVAIALALTFITLSASGQSGLNLPPNLNLPPGVSTFVDGVEAYIYGYPLLMLGTTERVGSTVPNPDVKLGAAPLNQFGKEKSLPDYTFTAVVLPSTSTLYASSFLNLKVEPVILHIPNMGSRFFILQMLDAWTEVSPESPGSRLGSAPGDYALVGPDFTGDLPASIQHVIHMPTNTMWMIGRIYTNGTQQDIDTVIQFVYSGLKLTPLSHYSDAVYDAPANIPVEPTIETVTPPLQQVAGMDACAFYGALAASLKYNPPILPQDKAIVKRLENIGIIQGESFDCTTLDQNKLVALQLAVNYARNFLTQTQATTPTSTKWTVLTSNVGTYGAHYLIRAEVARSALGANNPVDAVYGYTQFDGTGASLNGSKNYKIHFDATGNQSVPPASGFWSLTIYDLNGKLVQNPVPWNAVGMPAVQGHSGACLNSDKSLDLYLQPTAPPTGSIQYCNWLPTPPGEGYIAFLRLYWPAPNVLDNSWIPPAIKAN